jgi:hypothetical protein
MQSSIQQFTTGIDGLISHIDFEEAKAEYFKDGLLRYSGDNEFCVEFRFFVLSVISKGATNGKRFLYNSVIVSLYGYLESYIENVAEEYVSQLGSDCVKYSDVPTIVRERHLELSIDLLRDTKRSRILEKEEKTIAIKRIVNNMNSCINEHDEFTLNEDAYSIHTSNFRYDSIHTIFQQAGVTGILRLALEKEDLRREISTASVLNGSVDKKILISLLSSQLDDLAQRRNEISHGNLNSDLESLELYRARAKFIRCLGVAIHEVLSEKLNEYLFPIISKFNLGAPAEIYPKQSVLGFNFVAGTTLPINFSLAIGDEIFSFNEKSNKKLIIGRVVALKYNNVDSGKIFFDKDATITIKVNFKLTSRMGAREVFIRA